MFSLNGQKPIKWWKICCNDRVSNADIMCMHCTAVAHVGAKEDSEGLNCKLSTFLRAHAAKSKNVFPAEHNNHPAQSFTDCNSLFYCFLAGTGLVGCGCSFDPGLGLHPLSCWLGGFGADLLSLLLICRGTSAAADKVRMQLSVCLGCCSSHY